MSRYFLSRVQVEGFRGINNQDHPLDIKFKTDAVNSVFAANGLGKSSLFEALLYAIHGSIPKLDRLPTSESPQEYYCNRFHTTGCADIELTLTPDDGGGDVVIRVQRSAGGVRTVSSPSGHPDSEGLLHALDEDSTLVDHTTFARFLGDTPLERGRSFSSLLGMSYLSQVRQALEMVSNSRTVNSDFGIETRSYSRNSLQQQISSCLRGLREDYLKLVGKQLAELVNHDSVVSCSTEALRAVPLLCSFFVDKDIASVDFGVVLNAIKSAENSEAQNKLRETIGRIASLQNLVSDPSETGQQELLEKHIDERDTALQETRGPTFQHLYETVKQILESGAWEDLSRCPACESVPAVSPLEFITNQLSRYARVSAADAEIRKAWRQASWPTRLSRLEGQDGLVFNGEEKTHARLDNLFDKGSPTIEDARSGFARLVLLGKRRETILEELARHKEEIQKALPPSLVTLTEQVECARRIAHATANHKNLIKQFESTTRELNERQAWKSFIEKACTVFSAAEAALSEKRTKDMQSQYQQMFSQIMNLSEIVPSLRKQAGSEGLQLRLDKFFSLKDTSAVALLPESFRNALAMSIFLSAALANKGKPRFLVLDDVTSSFDAGHQFQLMELLRREVALPLNPQGFQVIILSHDGLLEKYFDTLASKKEWHHQRLQGLPPLGAVISQGQIAERLRADAEVFLKAGQVKQGEPLIRQHLEYRLLEIIRKVTVPVPLDFAMKDHSRMVSNCLDVIKQAVKLHKKAGSLILDPLQQSDLDTAHVPALMGNWVSHYETGISASLSPYVLLSVLDTVDKFADCFKYDCSCASSGPKVRRYYRSLSAKDCGC